MSAVELVDACAGHRDAAAWEEFVRRFQRLIATVALRTARRWGQGSPELVDDLVQETFVKLCADNCRLLREFEPAHPDAIFGFLKVITANLVHDYFKAMAAAKRPHAEAAVTLEGMECASAESAGGSPCAIERDILLQQIDSCLRRNASGPHAERDRNIFWLYYRQGLSARAIAELPSIGLTTKGVESTIHRLTQEVRRELAGFGAAETSAVVPGGETSARGATAGEGIG